MAITFVNSVTPIAGSSLNSILVSYPASIVAGNLLIAVVNLFDSSTATATAATAGWNLLRGPDRFTTGNIIGTYTFYKIATGTESGTATFNFSTIVGGGDAVMFQYSGTDTVNPFGSITGNSNGNATSTTRTGLSVTTTLNNSVVVYVSIGYNGAPSTTPSGFTQRVPLWDITNIVYDRLYATPTTTGDITHTQSLNDSYVVQMIVLNEPSAGTAGYINVWNGSAWVLKPIKVWNGSSWVTKPGKFWNGSSWVAF